VVDSTKSSKASENSIRLELQKKGKSVAQAAQVKPSFPCRARGHYPTGGQGPWFGLSGHAALARLQEKSDARPNSRCRAKMDARNLYAGLFVRSESWKPHRGCSTFGRSG
jgi:hypothetical protein